MDYSAMCLLSCNILVKVYLAWIAYKYVYRKRAPIDDICDGPVDYTQYYRR